MERDEDAKADLRTAESFGLVKQKTPTNIDKFFNNLGE